MVDCESQGSEVRDQCGVAMQAALRVLEGRWKMMILAQLFYSGRVMRLSELKREIADISQKMLIQQLRALEEEGIVERTVYPVVPPKVEYRMTEWGQSLCPVLDGLLKWQAAKTTR